MAAPATAALPATLTLAQASATLRALSPAVAGGAALEIDASALQDFDSAVLALLLQLRRQAQAAGGELRVTGAPAPLVELARLYGVEAALPGL